MAAIKTAVTSKRGQRGGNQREDGDVANDAAAEADTFPKLLIHNARVRGDKPALRHKDLGIWQTWTWSQVLDEVRAFAVGLESSASSAATRSRSSAPTSRGSIGRCARRRRSARCRFRFTPTRSPTRWPMCSNMPRSRVAVAENQEQVDKIVSIADRVPKLTHIIYDEPRGLRDYDHARLTWINEVHQDRT